MRFLADTNVLSEARHPQGDPSVKDRLRSLPQKDLFTCAVVLGELEKGISMLPVGRRKDSMRLWLDGIEELFGERILPFDTPIAKLWGRIYARGLASGHRLPPVDSQIAATALHHKLTVVTRNERDFAPTGAKTWNPWEADAP